MDYSTSTLAKGCFGKVYKEKYNGSWVAMKKVPVGLVSKEQLERECRVYHSVHHYNVVKLLRDPYLKQGKWHIPLEFIFGEDLETAMFKVEKSKIQLTPSVKATIITGMCEGLFHLHNNNIVHQDLKPDNIMVEHGTHRAVIIDMGLAKFSISGISSAENLGNEAYSAPEILHLNGVRNKRSDVWAMGKIIAELWAKARLATDSVSDTTVREILRDNPYCNTVAKMVVTSPTHRATMAGVINEIRRADPGARLKRRLPTPFPHEVRNHDLAVAPHNPPPREALDPLFTALVANQFSGMSIPSGLLQDGTMIRSWYSVDYEGSMELEYRKVVRKGLVVKYEHLKIIKWREGQLVVKFRKV